MAPGGRRGMAWLALALAMLPMALGLDNGLIVPPMGWSSWYGFTSNIDEQMLRQMADGMVSSGLHKAGFEHIWIDDGWAIGRDNKTGHVIVDPKLFPSGMRNLSDYMHSKGLKFGIYTSKGPLTCLGYQPTQPNRPGSCGFEQIDADVYANEWQVDQVKDDGCGQCPQHEPFAAMRDALNKTGRRIWYAIHSSTVPGSPNATVANMWRTGGDLSSSSFDMWTNRLDLATTAQQASLAGPGAFPNPDFLEVGYSPRNPKGAPRVQSALEQRSMFTMWAALPGPLILSADLRPGSACGGIDSESLLTLTNPEVIAVNQDPTAAPMRPLFKQDGLEAWRKPLSEVNDFAVVLFHRNTSGSVRHGLPQADFKAAPVTGDALTVGECQTALKFNLSVGSKLSTIQLQSTNQTLCVGPIGQATCANPPSPQLGLVQCNPSDPKQLWHCPYCTGNASGAQIFNADNTRDLNNGPVCPGTTSRALLNYVSQGHDNEMFFYDLAAGGVIRQGNSCINTMASSHTPSPPPTPPTPQPQARDITVTWNQLGLNSDVQIAVRDLWLRKDLGTYTGSFKASVQFHEAAIYRFSRLSD